MEETYTARVLEHRGMPGVLIDLTSPPAAGSSPAVVPILTPALRVPTDSHWSIHVEVYEGAPGLIVELLPDAAGSPLVPLPASCLHHDRVQFDRLPPGRYFAGSGLTFCASDRASERGSVPAAAS